MAVFEVYAGDMLIHHSQSPSPDVKIITPKLTLQVNSAGSFTCKIPPSNIGFDTVERLTTVITVKKDGVDLWGGRIISEEADFWGNRSLTCEGELAYLNDTSQPPHEYHGLTVRGFLQTLINIHNTKVDSSKQFSVGVVTVTDPNDSLYRYTNFESTMEAIKEKMIDRLGGYLLVRKENGVRYLDYLAEPINTCTQTIEFGKNLLDFSKSWDLTEFVTVLIPQGEHLEEHPIDSNTGEEIEALDAYVDVSSVNGGSIYVYDQQMVNAYGWIEKRVSWSDVSVPSNLLRKANEYLSDVQFDNMILELSAVDLSYMMGSTAEGLKLFDKIHCISEPHGMDRYFPLVKLEIPLDNPSDTTYTLGDNEIKSSLSASLRDDRIETKQQFDSLPSTTKLIDDAISEAYSDAEAIMNAKTNGYVTIVTEEDQTGIHSEKIVISDNKNYLNATRKWEWGLNGLAYYRNGTNIGLALTMDGAIVADRITTGTLNAARIKAGVLSDVNNNNYWNLETGEFRLTASASSTIGGKTVDTIATEKATSTLNTFVNGTYATDKTNLKNQIDGKAETWYQDDDPSGNWYKPSQGIDERAEHVGDLWYNTTNNTTWIYQKSGSTYSWQQENVPDDVFDQIDGKAQIFTSQPVPPYNVGDLWFGGTNSDIKTCTRARLEDDPEPYFHSTDWVKYNKYTDDSAFDAFRNGSYATFVTNTNTGIQNAQNTANSKIITYYQTSAPTTHNTGDLWIDTDEQNKLYRWNGSQWVNVQDGGIQSALTAASNAQTTADGKIVTFAQASMPTATDVGDLWIDTDDQNKLYRWNGSSWVQLSDSSAANAAVSAYDSALNSAAVLAKLSNGWDGIYSQYESGVLKYYINASAINTGYLSANFIHGGTIQSKNTDNMYIYCDDGKIISKGDYFTKSQGGETISGYYYTMLSGGELKLSRVLSGVADPNYELQMGLNELIYSRNGYQRGKLRFIGANSTIDGGVGLYGLSNGSRDGGGWVEALYDIAGLGKTDANYANRNAEVHAGYDSGSENRYFISLSASHETSDGRVTTSKISLYPSKLLLEVPDVKINGSVGLTEDITVKDGNNDNLVLRFKCGFLVDYFYSI